MTENLWKLPNQQHRFKLFAGNSHSQQHQRTAGQIPYSKGNIANATIRNTVCSIDSGMQLLIVRNSWQADPEDNYSGNWDRPKSADRSMPLR